MLRISLLPALLLTAALTGCFGAEEPVQDAGAGAALTNTTRNATVPVAAPIALSVSTSGIYPINPGFAPATLEAKEGANVTVTLMNADPNPLTGHDWVLEGVDGAATEVLASNAEGTVTFIAPAAGEYKFFCSVADHRARGMEGTFTVS